MFMLLTPSVISSIETEEENFLQNPSPKILVPSIYALSLELSNISSFFFFFSLQRFCFCFLIILFRRIEVQAILASGTTLFSLKMAIMISVGFYFEMNNKSFYLNQKKKKIRKVDFVDNIWKILHNQHWIFMISLHKKLVFQ